MRAVTITIVAALYTEAAYWLNPFFVHPFYMCCRISLLVSLQISEPTFVNVAFGTWDTFLRAFTRPKIRTITGKICMVRIFVSCWAANFAWLLLSWTRLWRKTGCCETFSTMYTLRMIKLSSECVCCQTESATSYHQVGFNLPPSDTNTAKAQTTAARQLQMTHRTLTHANARNLEDEREPGTIIDHTRLKTLCLRFQCHIDICLIFLDISTINQTAGP